jgi:uncharacterized protein
MTGETNLDILISTMKPRLNDGEYVFCSLKTEDIDVENCLFFFREREGITIICTREYADNEQLTYSTIFAWLTLEVHSALEAVGLTAAFSQALGAHQISCNVVAGYFHDHIFVPIEKGKEAVKVLENLAKTKFEKDPSV